MERAPDIMTPLEEKQKPKRKNKPWYTSQLLEQRKFVRNRERAYIQHKENHHWKAFTREQNRYNRMLDYNKRHHLIMKIDKANKDSKQLFRTLNSLLGNKSENPLPIGTTNDQLAEDFADFFLNKIDKIRGGLKTFQHTSLNN